MTAFTDTLDRVTAEVRNALAEVTHLPLNDAAERLVEILTTDRRLAYDMATVAAVRTADARALARPTPDQVQWTAPSGWTPPAPYPDR